MKRVNFYSSENILKRDREETGIIPTTDQLLDWRIRLKELKSEYEEGDVEYRWLEKQIQYCDEELITLTHINA